MRTQNRRLQSTVSRLARSRWNEAAFTLGELSVVLVILTVLAVAWLPALANIETNTGAFQCLNNQRRIIQAWRMYAEDNADFLAPNDYPYTTAYYTYPNKTWMKSWVCGTMEQALDAGNAAELTDPVGSALSAYITNASLYRCPADNFYDPRSHKLHVRSYSMNSAVGTVWWSSYDDGPGGPRWGRRCPVFGWTVILIARPQPTGLLTANSVPSFVHLQKTFS